MVVPASLLSASRTPPPSQPIRPSASTAAPPTSHLLPKPWMAGLRPWGLSSPKAPQLGLEGRKGTKGCTSLRPVSLVCALVLGSGGRRRHLAGSTQAQGRVGGWVDKGTVSQPPPPPLWEQDRAPGSCSHASASARPPPLGRTPGPGLHPLCLTFPRTRRGGCPVAICPHPAQEETVTCAEPRGRA